MRAILPAAILVAVAACAWAECPLDHLVIGCNQDGLPGTADDQALFVDCRQKYRDSGQTEYAHWFYPLRKSIFPSYSHRIGEPGFDAFQDAYPHAAYTYDPNRALTGVPDLDYSIIVECLSLSPGLRAVHKDYPQFTLDGIGRTFNHSYVQSLRGDSHLHMSYQAADGGSLQWITFRVTDGLADGQTYKPSTPFTVVFNIAPPTGDLAINGGVGLPDLRELCRYWLREEGSQRNDFYERADTDRDGTVDLVDFSRMARNWRIPPTERGPTE